MSVLTMVYRCEVCGEEWLCPQLPQIRKVLTGEMAVTVALNIACQSIWVKETSAWTLKHHRFCGATEAIFAPVFLVGRA